MTLKMLSNKLNELICHLQQIIDDVPEDEENKMSLLQEALDSMYEAENHIDEILDSE